MSSSFMTSTSDETSFQRLFKGSLESNPGLPDGIFSKNSNLGKFWWVLQWQLLTYMAIWSILRPFGIFCDHLVHFIVIWLIFPVLVSCSRKNLAALVKS
jgi:hypothetical protein